MKLIEHLKKIEFNSRVDFFKFHPHCQVGETTIGIYDRYNTHVITYGIYLREK